MGNTIDRITNALTFTPQPAVYATTNWIRGQRVAALALMVLGLTASALAPISTGATAGLVTPLFIGGSVLFGASLIQQSIGDAPNCHYAKVSRAAAGALIMLIPVFGWIPGAILWHHSHMENQRSAIYA